MNPPRSTTKRYDRAYFDRWYRDPRHRVRTPAELARNVALVVAIAEHVLERSLRTVLDLGCGEGAWQPVLRRLRPAASYLGIDPSAYAVERYGRTRKLKRGRITELDSLGIERRFDLVIVNDVLHYLTDADLASALRQVRARVGGVAYLPAFTRADRITGDFDGIALRSPARYRRLFRAAGLVHCGLQCYVGADRVGGLAALERPEEGNE